MGWIAFYDTALIMIVITIIISIFITITIIIIIIMTIISASGRVGMLEGRMHLQEGIHTAGASCLQVNMMIIMMVIIIMMVMIAMMILMIMMSTIIIVKTRPLPPRLCSFAPCGNFGKCEEHDGTFSCHCFKVTPSHSIPLIFSGQFVVCSNCLTDKCCRVVWGSIASRTFLIQSMLR